MRVTLINKYYCPPHVGGIEQSLNMLAEGLASRPGVSANAIVSNEAPVSLTETIANVRVTRLARAFAYASTPVAFGMKRAIREAARGQGPADVFHLHFPYPWGELAFLRSRVATPAVLTYHSDIVRQRFLGAAYAPIQRRLLDRVERIIVGAPQMIASSPFLAEHAEKCRVVPFGIRVGRFAETPAIASRAAVLRSRHSRPVVLFVGRLIYYKGVDVLVRAMADVDADLVVIGGGPLEEQLRVLAGSLGISERVAFLSQQPEDELVAWYHAADVLCLPSVARSEAYGLVQLEAHASGTPVVSTRLDTGVPFVNQDGVTGLTVPPGDAGALACALQTLVTDDGLRARMGAAARERAGQDFTIEGMVDRVLAVYEEVA
jgi:glycosyltransferase involved in cell wall biosynthesis